MDVPDNLKYTSSHEWVKTNGNGTITVGITDHAQETLGDLVFVELPEIGKKLDAREEVAVVESVKTVADIYAPVAGVVTDNNQELTNSPELINYDAYAAWLFKMKPDNIKDLEFLFDANTYLSSCQDRE